MSIMGAESAGGELSGITSREPNAEPRLDPNHRDKRAAWDRRWRRLLERAEQDLARAKEVHYQCATARRLDFYFLPLNVNCDDYEERLEQAERRLREVKRNRYNWDGRNE